MVALEAEAGRHAYTLFVEANGPSDEILRRLGADLETALQENYHYQYCRELGQLEGIKVFRIEGGGLERRSSIRQSEQ